MMSRIFSVLSAINLILLALVFGAGVRPNGGAGVQHHILLALFTCIFAIFVHSLVYVYFLGTGRWIKEFVTRNGVPEKYLARSRRLKAGAFPIALYAALMTLAGAVSGGFLYSRFRGGTEIGVAAKGHLVVGVAVFALNAYAAWREVKLMRANAEIIGELEKFMTGN